MLEQANSIRSTVGKRILWNRENYVWSERVGKQNVKCHKIQKKKAVNGIRTSKNQLPVHKDVSNKLCRNNEKKGLFSCHRRGLRTVAFSVNWRYIVWWAPRSIKPSPAFGYLTKYSRVLRQSPRIPFRVERGWKVEFIQTFVNPKSRYWAVSMQEDRSNWRDGTTRQKSHELPATAEWEDMISCGAFSPLLKNTTAVEPFLLVEARARAMRWPKQFFINKIRPR